MAKDPREGHPEFAHTDPPTPAKRVMGVRIPPLRSPPEPKEEPAMPPKTEPLQVERGGSPPAPSHDPWVQRIVAATGLVAALSAAGWGGLKISERDVISGTQAEKLNHALTSCEGAVTKLTKKVEEGEARDAKNDALDAQQRSQILVQAHAIWFLNGQVSPVYGWPEPSLGSWDVGVDGLHKHNRRGGSYPGSE